LNGVLVHGENFQALNLLQARYHGEVKCVHIDPPYNTDTSGFLYKNNYRHSSWLSMMENRIAATMNLFSASGNFMCHIDEREYERLHLLFARFPLIDAGTVIWDKRNPMTGGGGVASQHEYIMVRAKTDDALKFRNANARIMLNKAKELVAKNNGIVSEKAQKEYARWVKNQPGFSGGDKAFSFLDANGLIYQSVSLQAPEPRTNPKFFIPLVHPKTNKPCVVPSNGFSRTPETLGGLLEKDMILFGKDHTIQPRQKIVLSADAVRQLTSIVPDATRGKADLDSLGAGVFPYSHSERFYRMLISAAMETPADIILDYFAGSGTTAHAVINLNREDGGARKYILVELGHHFKNVLLPRIKKAVYAKEWKDGAPCNRNGSDRDGISQFVKCIRLESYEDTLDSLRPKPRSALLEAAETREMLEDYHLRYALGEETAHSASLLGKDFIDPFAYNLSVVRDGIRHDEPADLAETFNFLLGLRVETRQMLDGALAITGTDKKGENCLVIWRNVRTMNAPQLDKWFKTHHANQRGKLNRIYVNGDQNLSALKGNLDRWSVEITELVFRRLMFEGSEIDV